MSDPLHRATTVRLPTLSHEEAQELRREAEREHAEVQAAAQALARQAARDHAAAQAALRKEHRLNLWLICEAVFVGLGFWKLGEIILFMASHHSP